MRTRENLTDKDMSVLREADRASVQVEQRVANLKDYSLRHRVTMEWDLSPEAVRDQMFKLTIDDKEVILDLEELLRYTRWV